MLGQLSPFLSIFLSVAIFLVVCECISRFIATRQWMPVRYAVAAKIVTRAVLVVGVWYAMVGPLWSSEAGRRLAYPLTIVGFAWLTVRAAFKLFAAHSSERDAGRRGFDVIP